MKRTQLFFKILSINRSSDIHRSDTLDVEVAINQSCTLGCKFITIIRIPRPITLHTITAVESTRIYPLVYGVCFEDKHIATVQLFVMYHYY